MQEPCNVAQSHIHRSELSQNNIILNNRLCGALAQSPAMLQNLCTRLHNLVLLCNSPVQIFICCIFWHCPLTLFHPFRSFLYSLTAVFAVMPYTIPLQCCLLSCCLLTCCCCCLCCCCCCGLLLPKDDTEYDYYAYEDLVREEGEPIATQPKGTGVSYNGTGETEGKTPIQYAPLLMNPAHRSLSAHSV